MKNNSCTVFSDESYTTAERYRSIAAFSFPTKNFNEIDASLWNILKESNVKEFKWQKLKNAKYRFCADKLLKYILDNLYAKELRVDVLIWDTDDTRHKIQGRNDIANFERMFFHLLKNVMTKREKNTKWNIYPDERCGIDWDTINECLGSVGKRREFFFNLFGDVKSEQFFHINAFKQVSSNKPCCQIADLFAGLSVFSKTAYPKYNDWCLKNNKQGYLFKLQNNVSFANTEKERFQILNTFISRCKDESLGVSLNKKKCLYTFNPEKPINFWHYVPQHSFDKAPIRKS